MEEGKAAGVIKVELSYSPLIHYSMQQNKMAVVHPLMIENVGENVLQNVKVTLVTEPDFGEALPVEIGVIPVGQQVRVDTLECQLSDVYLAACTEPEKGCFRLCITAQDVEIFQQTYPLDILAYDQWTGMHVFPELLTAFVTPDNGALRPLLRRASAILERWTGNGTLDEYQSRNPDRVRKQMAAIYAAIAEQGILGYDVWAGSDRVGQRIRRADALFTQKAGSYLDLALLYASCLEAAGIHPLLVLTEERIFAGGWLVRETFPDGVVDDVSLLTNRMAEGVYDITVVDTSLLSVGQEGDFDTAVQHAERRLTDHRSFLLALDVQRMRFSGMQPLPQHNVDGLVPEEDDEERQAKMPIHEAPQNIHPYDLSALNKDIVMTKQLLWERHLLDLSLRNSLLNLRGTKNMLQLMPTDLAGLEDALLQGTEFRLLHKPTDWEGKPTVYGLHPLVAASDPIRTFVEVEREQNRLRSYLTPLELEKSLTHLYRTSRMSLEESGANTLFLALGLLKWYETPVSERPRYAPLLLLPVELVRKSVAKGYIIRSREEDIMLNITLLEMLRQNFGIAVQGLDPLPADENGVNVRLIYSLLRNSIKDQPKWDVEEQVLLGVFSFNKFIMWNDIHNNSHKLAQNKIVSSLINGKIEWEVDTDSVDATVLDKTVSPDRLVLPIGADSSQLEAIYEAMNDRTFILHGPPGTGKSQTITNIIVNALYQGKRVLFVAEKMAALSVVQNRLAALGLAPFCLEIHSNKTKKSAVVAQLKETIDLIRHSSPENYKREANRLLSLRSELGGYVDKLHRVYPFGLSLYEAIVGHQALQEVEPAFEIPADLLEGRTPEEVSDWKETIDELVQTGHAYGHPHAHPLMEFHLPTYSASLKEEVAELLDHGITLLTQTHQWLGAMLALLGTQDASCRRSDLPRLMEVARILLQTPELTEPLLMLHGCSERMEEYMELVAHGKKRNELEAEITRRFQPELLDLNAKQLLADWRRASTEWFLPRFWKRRKIRKELSSYARAGVDSKEVEEQLRLVIQWQEESKEIHPYKKELNGLFGRYGRNEDWDQMEHIIVNVKSLHLALLHYLGDAEKVEKAKQQLAVQLREGIRPFRELYGRELVAFMDGVNTLTAHEQQWQARLGIEIDKLYGEDTHWNEQALGRLQLWRNHLDSLKECYQWMQLKQKMEKVGIGFVFDAYKEQALETDRIKKLFQKSLYEAVIRYILSKESKLELFNGKLFNNKIDKYRRLNARFEELVRLELFARLSSRIPWFTQEAVQNSEVGILQRNIRSNARGISIRKLFDQIPTLLSRMCPCMLMSPISVAQYIDPDAEKFDLVIFDEASQMPTYEAVGAIARGKNVIIVGDPKQMPPTNFFSANATDEERVEMEDLESILDDCLALSIPSKYLLWHYRSKHESLIAFSNSEFYDNKLLTFPSPDNIESKVRLVSVEGYYDKGRSRQNKQEAQAVVDEIVRRLRDEELNKKSIGVVTFSIAQQSLIEDLLSDVFKQHPELETKSSEGKEPLFVKNLENVQGDERDVILFSVGYGPDASGRVSMNFGPLNREGGERRLNVAVSRARYEMMVFSTLKSEQVDLNRTTAKGVAGLKRFLEYAERGTRLVANNQIPTTADNRPSLEGIVSERLRALGYVVHTNIGVSGYKVDIGIVDPLAPSTYRLGILCDGENYHRSKTVRDREIVQTSILQRLGWNIYRIWTMNWREHAEEILQEIQDILEGRKKLKKPELTERKKTPAKRAKKAGELPAEVKKTYAYEEGGENQSIPQAYKVTRMKQYGLYDMDQMGDPNSRDILREQVLRVVAMEAPISKSLLCKRVVYEWGLSRVTPRPDAILTAFLDTLGLYKTTYGGLTFYWRSPDMCLNYKVYRPESDRDPVDLPPEEVANGLRQILKESVSLQVADLLRAGGQLFGLSRGKACTEAMQRGLNEALKRKYMKRESDRVVLC